MKKEELIQMILTENHVVGLRQVIKKINSEAIKCVIVALDSDDFVLKTVKETIGDKDIKIHKAFKMSELGRICQIDVATAVVGIIE